MHILLAAATRQEIEPALHILQQPGFQLPDHQVEILITGVGSIATTYQLTQTILERKPDFLLQAGIAGSFDPVYPPGSIVLIKEEVTGDTGVEENNTFNDLFDMGFQPINAAPYTGRGLVNPRWTGWQFPGLPWVKGISVNEVTTRPARITLLQQKYAPVVESMEGAAFHYVSLQQEIPFLQLRSVSNFVGERDKSKWTIKRSIDVLNKQLIHILQSPLLSDNKT